MKTLMQRNTPFRIVALLLVSVLPGALAAQKSQLDLAHGKKSVKNILIVPPQANLVKSSMKGSEPLVPESEAMASGLVSVVAQSLRDRGCNILPNAFSPDTLDHNTDLKYELSDVQERYDKLQVLVKKHSNGVREGRFSLGDEVANLSPGASADALVFVRANGYLPTAGVKTFVVVTGMGYSRNFARLEISIVDAQTGTVLYFAEPKVYGDFIRNPDSMKNSIDGAFSQLRYQTP